MARSYSYSELLDKTSKPDMNIHPTQVDIRTETEVANKREIREYGNIGIHYLTVLHSTPLD